jgi:hypothetical protein
MEPDRRPTLTEPKVRAVYLNEMAEPFSVDGSLGGVLDTPSGPRIIATFYAEVLDVPKDALYSLSGEIVERYDGGPIVDEDDNTTVLRRRRLGPTITMDFHTAVGFHTWLGENIRASQQWYRERLAEREKEQSSTASMTDAEDGDGS